MSLSKEFNTIKVYIQKENIHNFKVSKRSAYWQLDHLLTVIISISHTVRKSNPQDYKKAFNLNRFLILTLGFIPRGAGKAPKEVISELDSINQNNLLILSEKAEKLFNSFDHFQNHQFMNHPYFGHMNTKQSKKFIKIHTQHHLKIIRDIYK